MRKCVTVFLIVIALFCTVCSNSKKEKVQDTPKATEQQTPETTKKPSRGERLALQYSKEINKLEDYDYRGIEPINSKVDTSQLNQIMFSADYEPEGHRIIVCQTIEYYNATKIPLQKLYLNAYANDAVFRKDGGKVQVDKIQVAGKGVKFRFYKKSDTILEVPFHKTLNPEQSIKIDLRYQVTVPKREDRLGYNTSICNVGNAIIQPAVYDQKGFALHEYVNIGDAFYTDMADYKATITIPKGYDVAATGERVGRSERNGKVQYEYEIQKVRDFAFNISDKFKTCNTRFGDTLTTVYYTNNSEATAKFLLTVAGKSLKVFGNKYGAYPYKTLDIVEMNMENFGGMEYPCLVMITVENPLDHLGFFTGMDSVKYSLETATMHEIGHQWLYQIVGNDEVMDPWLDEGMNTYGETLFYRTVDKQYLTDDQNQMMKKLMGEIRKEYKNHGINDSLYDYKGNEYAYAVMTYQVGGEFMGKINDAIGDKEFGKVLKEYINEFAYDEVTTEEFKKFWKEHTKEDLSKIYDDYFR